MIKKKGLEFTKRDLFPFEIGANFKDPMDVKKFVQVPSVMHVWISLWGSHANLE